MSAGADGRGPGPPAADDREAYAEPATHGLERALWAASGWVVPAMMALSYGFLALAADTQPSVKLWMAGGFGLVLIAWLSFRALAAMGYTDVIIRHLTNDQEQVLGSMKRLKAVKELVADA